jgi:hypothetical protein
LPSFLQRTTNSADGAPTRHLRPNRALRLTIALLVSLCVCLVLLNWRLAPGLARYDDRPYFPDDTAMGTRVAYAAPVLESMGEPSLWRLSQRGQDAAYRFLCVPSLIGRPLAVRITRKGDGAELRMIELDNHADSRTDRVRTERKLTLSLAQWADLDSLAERAGFWAMPSQDNRVISDGTAMIVEGVRGGLYHGVHRQSPPPGPYRRLCYYVLALSGLSDSKLVGNHEPLAVGLGQFALVKTRKLALAVRFLEHSQVGLGGSDYNGATYEWFLQGDGSGDFSRENVASGKGEVVGNPDERWDQVVITCGPMALTWAQCYSDSDYLSVRRTECKVDRFDVVAIAASDWSKRSELKVDDKYVIWSVVD